MRIVDFKYKKFNFNLSPPLKISNQIIKKKDVILLKARDEYGNSYLGEISPLIGFSNESIEDCEIKLNEVTEGILEIEFNELNSILNNYYNYPSLVFGLEQLLLSAENNNNSYDSRNYSVKSNGLIGFENHDVILKNAKKLVNNGFDTLKLKIGRPNFTDDYKIIENIDKEFRSKIKLRLDNNGNWNFSEAISNINKLSRFNIEYIEQPVLGENDLLNVAEVSPLEIAADESISSYKTAVRLIESGKINYLILKPSIRIGINEAIKIIEFANSKKINIIITSAFETVIGRNTLIYLASLTNHNLAHGLSTPLLGSDVIKSKMNYGLPIVNFNYSDVFKTLSLDF